MLLLVFPFEKFGIVIAGLATIMTRRLLPRTHTIYRRLYMLNGGFNKGLS